MILSTMKKSSCASCVIQTTTLVGRYLRRFTRIYPVMEIPPNRNGCLNDYLIRHSNHYSRRGVFASIYMHLPSDGNTTQQEWVFEWFLVYYLFLHHGSILYIRAIHPLTNSFRSHTLITEEYIMARTKEVSRNWTKPGDYIQLNIPVQTNTNS